MKMRVRKKINWMKRMVAAGKGGCMGFSVEWQSAWS